MKDKSLALRMSFIYLFLFLGLACTYPYLTLYLQSKGMDNTQIGIAYAVFNTTSIIMQPVVGFITDRFSNKRTMLLLLSLINAGIIVTFVLPGNFLFAFLCFFLLSAFQSSLIPVTDAYVYEILDANKHLQFGKIRLSGSFGYAVGALAFGLVINSYGLNLVFYAYTVLMLILAVNYYFIRFRSNAGGNTLKFGDIKKLIGNKRFVILLLTVAVGTITTGSNGTYITMLVQKTGGDTSKLGIMWFIVSMSQMPVMFFGAKLIGRFGELNLYIVSMFLYSIRFFLDSVSVSSNMVLAVQLMDSITFTIYFVAVMNYLNKLVASDMKTLAITVYTAASGLGTLLGNVGGGIVVDHFGIFALYRIIAVISLIAMVLVIFLKQYDTKYYYINQCKKEAA